MSFFHSNFVEVFELFHSIPCSVAEPLISPIKAITFFQLLRRLNLFIAAHATNTIAAVTRSEIPAIGLANSDPQPTPKLTNKNITQGTKTYHRAHTGSKRAWTLEKSCSDIVPENLSGDLVSSFIIFFDRSNVGAQRVAEPSAAAKG